MVVALCDHMRLHTYVRVHRLMWVYGITDLNISNSKESAEKIYILGRHGGFSPLALLVRSTQYLFEADIYSEPKSIQRRLPVDARLAIPQPPGFL